MNMKLKDFHQKKPVYKKNVIRGSNIKIDSDLFSVPFLPQRYNLDCHPDRQKVCLASDKNESNSSARQIPQKITGF